MNTQDNMNNHESTERMSYPDIRSVEFNNLLRQAHDIITHYNNEYSSVMTWSSTLDYRLYDVRISLQNINQQIKTRKRNNIFTQTIGKLEHRQSQLRNDMKNLLKLKYYANEDR